MKRTKLKDRILPTYTKGEEIFNYVSHIVGAVLGLVATILLPIIATKHNNIYGIISGVIFGISIIILYLMSTLYHALKADSTAKKVFQVLDHCTIFIMIAGSYTPFCLGTLREYNPSYGYTILSIIWITAIIGIILNAIDLKKYKIFSMACYLLMGWCIIVKASILPKYLTITGFTLLLLGGIIYTIGAILYGLGKKHKYMHSIFHLCILMASFLHFFCILFYVI